jgi:ABC-type amino acid transport system permease subunit
MRRNTCGCILNLLSCTAASLLNLSSDLRQADVASSELGRTLLLTAPDATFGLLLGTSLDLPRVSGSPLLASLSWGYVWLLRSIPRSSCC